MLQLFPKARILALIAALALLTLAVACATAAIPTPAPTNTPVATATPVPTPTPSPDTGNWTSENWKDPIDDGAFLTIQLQATESTLDFPYDEPRLSVGCRQFPGVSVGIGMIVLWDAYVGSGPMEVDWRVNGEAAKTTYWLGRDEATILPISHELDNESLLTDLRRADKITLRLRRDFAESITAIWHPVGFAEAYKPVAAACNLTIP